MRFTEIVYQLCMCESPSCYQIVLRFLSDNSQYLCMYNNRVLQTMVNLLQKLFFINKEGTRSIDLKRLNQIWIRLFMYNVTLKA